MATKLDWASIDFSALVKSNIFRGVLVAALAQAGKMYLGHDIDPQSTAATADTILSIITELGVLWAGYHRITAQPETTATIVQKKIDPPSPPAKGV